MLQVIILLWMRKSSRGQLCPDDLLVMSQMRWLDFSTLGFINWLSTNLHNSLIINKTRNPGIEPGTSWLPKRLIINELWLSFFRGLSLHRAIMYGLDAPCKVSAHKRTIARSILLRIRIRFIGTYPFPDLAVCSPQSFQWGLPVPWLLHNTLIINMFWQFRALPTELTWN